MIELKFQFETTAELVEFVSLLSPEAKTKVAKPVKNNVSVALSPVDVDTAIPPTATDDKAIDAQRSALRALVSSKTTAGFKDEARAIISACDGAKNVTVLDPKFFAEVTAKITALG